MNYTLTYRARSTDARTSEKVLCQYCLAWMADPARHWIESTIPAPHGSDCEGSHHATRPTTEQLRVRLAHAEQSLEFRREEYAEEQSPARKVTIELAATTVQAAAQRLADRVAS